MLAHAAKEIADAKLQPDEEEEVMSRLRAAGNSQRLIELGSQLQSALGADGEGGMRVALAEAVRAGRELARLDEAAGTMLSSLEEVAGRVTDLENEVRHYAERIDADPATLRELESRADLLQSLKRKYGGTIDEVMVRGEQAAKDLESAGADLILLECIPSELGQRITEALQVPVIGIGAGPATDGQILVLYDVLGITTGRKPRFVLDCMQGASGNLDAMRRYVQAVKSLTYPAPEHCFS
jgi:DNA repair exonuclease SbcCD ATPase subunit